MMHRVDGSFRDSSGHVYFDDGKVLRTINDGFREHWLKGIDSGLLGDMQAASELVAFTEEEPLPDSWKTYSVEKIPFVSYPYEWCFSQLKDAAILTLALQGKALAKGMELKDASAYNVQYVGSRPIFIDLLSFESREDGRPWSAYRQFCMHFLAPLALCSRVDLRCGAMSRLWMDGIPLDLASKTLPWRSLLRPGFFWHIFLHSRMEHKHGDARKSADKAKSVKVSTATLSGIAEHLRSIVAGLDIPGTSTEWGDYYNDTNYSGDGADFKTRFVEKAAERHAGGALAVDLGANTGRYSRLLSPHFHTVVAPDVDPLAVERHYLSLKKNGPENILPLVLDLSNPSPSQGWAGLERESFDSRCNADFMTALALIHHLRITMGIPLELVAEYFARLLRPGGLLVLEFVPKEDSQTQRLLAVRKDVFQDYSLQGMYSAFASRFIEVEKASVPDSLRTLHLFRSTAEGRG